MGLDGGILNLSTPLGQLKEELSVRMWSNIHEFCYVHYSIEICESVEHVLHQHSQPRVLYLYFWNVNTMLMLKMPLMTLVVYLVVYLIVLYLDHAICHSKHDV